MARNSETFDGSNCPQGQNRELDSHRSSQHFGSQKMFIFVSKVNDYKPTKFNKSEEVIAKCLKLC